GTPLARGSSLAPDLVVTAIVAGSGIAVLAVQCILTPKTQLRAAIVGCGLIGHKRAAFLPPGSVTVCCDTLPDRAGQLGAAMGGAAAPTDLQATGARDPC